MDTPPATLQALYMQLSKAIEQGDKAAALALLADDATVTDTEGDCYPLRDYLEDFFWAAPERQVSHDIGRIDWVGEGAQVGIRFRVEIPASAFCSETTLTDEWSQEPQGWRLAARNVLSEVVDMDGRRDRAELTPPALKQQRLKQLLAQQHDWTADPEVPTHALPWLDRALEGVTVVGAGEGTHGTREHFRFKHWLFRYLAEHHGFTVLTFEESLSRTWAVNEYLLGRADVGSNQGDLRRELSGWMWPWATEEVLCLLEWMRAYNAGRGSRPPLRIAGVDMQDTAGALTLLLKLAPPDLWPLLERLQAAGGAGTDEFQALYPQLERQTAALPSTQAHLPTLQALVRQIGQAVKLEQADEAERMNIRDTAMADNLACAAAGAKTMFWAHNGHIRRGGAHFYPEFLTAGSVLAGRLGAAYFAVGLGTLGGDALFYCPDVPGGSALQPQRLRQPPVTTLLPRPGAGQVAALHWVGLPPEQDWSWLTEAAKFYEAGSIYNDDVGKYNHYILPQTFDLLVGTGPSTPSTPLAP